MRSDIEVGYKYASGSQVISGPAAVYKNMQVNLDVPSGYFAIVHCWIDLRGTPGGNCRVDLFTDGLGAENAFVYKQDALVAPGFCQTRVPPGKHSVSLVVGGNGGSVESASMSWVIAPIGTGNS